jgi:hypothetical protein
MLGQRRIEPLGAGGKPQLTTGTIRPPNWGTLGDVTGSIQLAAGAPHLESFAGCSTSKPEQDTLKEQYG